jgi:hypothetical protein
MTVGGLSKRGRDASGAAPGPQRSGTGWATVLVFCLVACLADVALADGPYAVQVAAYRDAAAAAAEAERLQQQGYDAFWLRAAIPGKGVWYRLYQGRYPSREKALAAAGRPGAETGGSSYIIRKLTRTEQKLAAEKSPLVTPKRDKPQAEAVPEKAPAVMPKPAEAETGSVAAESSPVSAKPAPTEIKGEPDRAPSPPQETAQLQEVAFARQAETGREVVSMTYTGRTAPVLSFFMDGDAPEIVADFPRTAPADGVAGKQSVAGDWIRLVSVHHDAADRRTRVVIGLAAEHHYRAFQRNEPDRGRFELGVALEVEAP